MEDAGTSDAFSPDEVGSIVKDAVEGVLGDQAYCEQQVARWTPAILEGCTQRLAGLGKPFKYVVTATLMQKTGAGLHTAASAYWDAATDGSRTIKCESKTMYCIVTVFALAL